MNIIDFGAIGEYTIALLPYVPLTLAISVFATLLGTVIGLVMALIKMARIPVLSQVSAVIVSYLRGTAIREIPEYQGVGGDFDSDRVEPHSPGLSDRLWYGGGSLRSAEWAGSAGMNWLVSNISSYENGEENFARGQRAQIDAYRAAHAAAHPAADPADARVSVARVFVPTDGATAAQREKYAAYVEARTPRTKQVHGGRMLIAQDVSGTNDEIVDFIQNDVAYQAADDYLFELPFEFELADWKHILDQLAGEIGPRLGWQPK